MKDVPTEFSGVTESTVLMPPSIAKARVGHELMVPVTPDNVACAFVNVIGIVWDNVDVTHLDAQTPGASTIHSALACAGGGSR